MQFPITIGLRRSRFLDAGLIMVTLLASGVTLKFPQTIAIQLLILAAIWVVMGVAWRQLSPKLSKIRLERSGRVSVIRRGESEFSSADFLPGATVHPWLTLLRLKTGAGDTCILIAAVDSLKRQDFRRLRVFLRWQADFNVSNDDA